MAVRAPTGPPTVVAAGATFFSGDGFGSDMSSPTVEQTYLGDTGLEVSRLCLGTGAFGSDEEWHIGDERQCLDLVETALDLGITFFDTANTYAKGESEEILGRAIDGCREDVVLASKVGSPMGAGPNDSGLSRRHVIEQAHASLDRLGTDYLDLYYVHRWDDATPIEETLAALDHLVEEGLVHYLGASTMASWRCMKALGTSDAAGYERFVCLQPEYNLVGRHEECNLLPVAADQNLGVVSWSPLAAGFLATGYETDESDDAASDDLTEDQWADDATDGQRADDRTPATWRKRWPFDVADGKAVRGVVADLAAEREATPIQVAIAWVLQSDLVDAPIVGPRTPAELRECVGALDVTLSRDDVDRLEEPIDPVWQG
jgi:aryl-alcohol dehydrogenase-like predicted oxidoreductase